MQTIQQPSDQELIKTYLKGDNTALEILISRYLQPIYGFVFSYTKNKEAAEDITQETFVKLWRNAKKIDPNKNMKSWLYTIAKNTALDYLKKKKAIPFSSFQTADDKNYLTEKLIDTGSLPDKIAESIEYNHSFLTAIDKLSDKYKIVLSMYYYEYLNFREIAQKLKEPINTIKSRHRRGLVLLKASLGTHGAQLS